MSDLNADLIRHGLRMMDRIQELEKENKLLKATEEQHHKDIYALTGTIQELEKRLENCDDEPKTEQRNDGWPHKMNIPDSCGRIPFGPSIPSTGLDVKRGSVS